MINQTPPRREDKPENEIKNDDNAEEEGITGAIDAVDAPLLHDEYDHLPATRRYYRPPLQQESSDSLYYDFVKSKPFENDRSDGAGLRWFRKYCRVLPLRILLLSLYLAFTLSSFWILDSIKEPALAILVEGDLGRHQPRAKMASFVVVVCIAMGMEMGERIKERRRLGRLSAIEMGYWEQSEDEINEISQINAQLARSWEDRNGPSSLQSLKKMGIRTSRRWSRSWRQSVFQLNEDDAHPSKITTFAFYLVGTLYIHAFAAVALALRQHSAFGHGASSATQSANGSWYYPTLGYVLFALIESYGSVCITIFWAFANSHLTLEAAERHYGSIIAVAQAGAIAGSTLSAVLAGRCGSVEDNNAQDSNDSLESKSKDAEVTPMLIFLACGCIAVGMAIMALYSRLFLKPLSAQRTISSTGVAQHYDTQETNVNKRSSKQCTLHSQSRDNSIFKDLFGGLNIIFRYEYLKLVLLVSVLYEIALTCMHYELNLIGLDRFGVGIRIVDESNEDPDYLIGSSSHPNDAHGKHNGITYIQFMGWYGQTVNVLSLFLSFYAFPRLIKHYGLRFTIRIFPTVLLFVTLVAFVLLPRNLYFLFLSLSICKALTYSVHDPSEEVLYMPTSDTVKFRAKFWIDVVGQRVAKAIGSAVNNYAGSVEGIVMYGSLPSVVAALTLWLACYQVGVLFDGLIQSGEIVGLEEEGEAELELRAGFGGQDEEGDAIELEGGDNSTKAKNMNDISLESGEEGVMFGSPKKGLFAPSPDISFSRNDEILL